MGRDKASLRRDGATLLERTIQQLRVISREVILVGRESAPPGARAVPDQEAGLGPVGGLLTGLRASRFALNVVVACDHPFLEAAVLRALLHRAGGYQAVIPAIGDTPQSLHAVYRKDCLRAVEEYVQSGGRSLRGLLPHLSVLWVEEAELAGLDPDFRSFHNVNTPEDWASVTDTGP